MAYSSQEYAESFQTFGTVRRLPECGSWVLVRSVPETDCRDAMGSYPLFMCNDWSRLPTDLETLGDDLVAVSMVLDPFGQYEVAELKNCFTAVCRPYKEHYVVDLKRNWNDHVSRHHSRNARNAGRRVEVDRCQQPAALLEVWCALYAELAARHGIRGIAQFSEECFCRQLQIPGIEAFRASYRGSTAAMVLWFRRDDVAYYHLGASSEAGYAVGASFALFHESLCYFGAKRLRWVNLGGNAGAERARDDGLGRFKAGWASGTRTALFCGRVFNESAYQMLTEKTGTRGCTYFPTYRNGELCS